ncbi:hypothetical protein MMC22_004836 [Lobaria immixta]|nr:hypothetical protein [Lobaria immixta]
MFPSSGDSHDSRDRTSTRTGAASQVPSPYHELRQWESDEDLIQLDSPELKSGDVTSKGKVRIHSSKEGRGMSQKGGRDVLRLREQPSLLDLYDHPRGRAEEESDETPTPRLHTEWNAKDQNFLHETLLEVKTTDEEQAVLYQNDQDTTWFGIIKHDGGLPIFQDYGRYATLMTNTSRSERSRDFMGVVDGGDTQYPNLVSFVGQTGTGKSTIIKLVIDLSARKDENHATPVVGPVGKNISTSGDVHLYSDPQTAGTDAPILYADCKGLDGGEQELLGAWRKARDKSGQTGPIKQKSGNINHGSEREIIWATSNVKKSRVFAVMHLYPRLLYTFSDVIAAAALETSSNQPVLLCAIILLNESKNNIDPELWDVQKATASLLDSTSQTVFKSLVFKKYAQFWRERHRRIEKVEDLLLSFYSSIEVVHIPISGRPNLINHQIQRLYKTIQKACASARWRKGELRMLLDADELQPYF